MVSNKGVLAVLDMVKSPDFGLFQLKLVHEGQSGCSFIEPAILFLLDTAGQLIGLESHASRIVDFLFRNFDNLWFGSKLYWKALFVKVNNIALRCGRDRAFAYGAPRDDLTLSCFDVFSWYGRQGKCINGLYHRK